MAAASPRGSFGSTNSPFSPSRSDEGMPPARVATAGQPNERASTSVRGVPSGQAGQHEDVVAAIEFEQRLAEIEHSGQRDVVAKGTAAIRSWAAASAPLGLVGAADQSQFQRALAADLLEGVEQIVDALFGRK